MRHVDLTNGRIFRQMIAEGKQTLLKHYIKYYCNLCLKVGKLYEHMSANAARQLSCSYGNVTHAVSVCNIYR